MMKKFAWHVYAGILYIVSVLLVVYGLVYFRILSVSYLMKRYMKTDRLLVKFNLSKQELALLTREILGLMKGSVQESKFTIVMNGDEVPFLNEKELRHLREIAEILQNANAVMLILLVVLVCSLYLFFRFRKSKILATGVFSGIVGIVVLGGALVALSYQNLSGFIDGFHKVFFKGYNWVLNPATDRLIYLCPNSLFREAITTLIVGVGVFLAVTASAALWRICRHRIEG